MKGAKRGMTSPQTIPLRIFLTIAGVITAVGLCVRVYLCMWDITAETTGQFPVSTRCLCVCAYSTKQWMTALSYLRKSHTHNMWDTGAKCVRECECRCDRGSNHSVYYYSSLTVFRIFLALLQNFWSAIWLLLPVCQQISSSHTTSANKGNKALDYI